MKTQPLYPQAVSLPPTLVTSENMEVEDSDKMEINNEFQIENIKDEKPHQEETDVEDKPDSKEEDKGEFLMENEIENTIFSKPIVSKMNANSLSQESKHKESTNKVESPKLPEENKKQMENQKEENEEPPHEDIKEKKFERKTKRRMSRDDAGVEYNQNPLDYLFPKEKANPLDSPKKIAKECEDVELENHVRIPELSKSLSHNQPEKKEEEHSRVKNPLSSSLILDNKKYKIVLRKTIKPG